MTGALRLVLVDRDGTLIQPPAGGRRYIEAPDEVELEPSAGAAVRLLNDRGIPVVVVTNQRAVALGIVSEVTLARIHQRVDGLLAAEGAHIDEWLTCPHDVDQCDCRKPQPGLVRRALERYAVSGADACMIGDAETDALAGASMGLLCIRMGTPVDGSVAQGWAGSLLEAVRLALASLGSVSSTHL